MCIRACMIKRSSSSTEKAIAQSPAETYLHAATTALCEAKGLSTLGQSLAKCFTLERVDSNTGTGLSHRAGLGKSRHIGTPEL